MKRLLILLLIVLFISGCNYKPIIPNEDINNQDATSTKITINGQESYCLVESCRSQWLSGNEGGKLKYFIEVVFNGSSQSNFSKIYFRVQDQLNTTESYSNKKENFDNNTLLTIGIHPAAGNYWSQIGVISTDFAGTKTSIKEEQMEIVWEKMNISGNEFNGEGYINIKQDIDFCPEGYWINGQHYVVKNDPDYVCDHKYIPYIPTQRIYFKCEDGIKREAVVG